MKRIDLREIRFFYLKIFEENPNKIKLSKGSFMQVSYVISHQVHQLGFGLLAKFRPDP